MLRLHFILTTSACAKLLLLLLLPIILILGKFTCIIMTAHLISSTDTQLNAFYQALKFRQCLNSLCLFQDANDLAATAGFKVKYYDPILQQLLKIKNFEGLSTSTEFSVFNSI